nr:YbaB/EbfC family nucleoid-associated protein [Neorickettsia helminthoeca]
MDLQGMLKGMQKKMSDIQEKKNAARYSGEAGGGLVKVTVDGNLDLQEIKIDNSLEGEEMSMIADLIIAAYNNAKEVANEDDQFSEDNLLKNFPLPFNMKKPPF